MSKYSNIVFIASLFGVALACATFYMLIHSTYANLQRASDATLLSQRTSGMSSHMRILNTQLASSENERKELEFLLVNNGEIVPLLQEIEKLGRSAKLLATVGSISSSEERISVTVKVSGNFYNTKHFLSLLENMPKAVFVESVRVVKERKGTVWDMEVVLVALKTEI